ncbi:hypothetical protein SAMN06264868_10499 [Venenivibrio stagnispumantis]|uniref:CAAX prenyl protease 2/Lysostaphin resistance protein A-like domain-containing protein n=1 Tax=Venenivibrio stagnispumantis TaxID=407998 RepID=A0AA45WKK3_9AQUI|nr:CPBP family intramembrane metalloprotease [Venenivibrio stagnispumantis]SMP06856.1 hypothetical protein SAMN06264868_10499 [Venenivibrio stagnispumantis]
MSFLNLYLLLVISLILSKFYNGFYYFSFFILNLPLIFYDIKKFGFFSVKGIIASFLLSALYLPFLNFSVFPTNQVVQILAEEIFFRGYIQNELLKIYNPFKSIVLSSILFMVAHLILNPSIFSGLTIFPSIIFGYLYFYSKSVISSFIFHLFSNWFFLSQFSN